MVGGGTNPKSSNGVSPQHLRGSVSQLAPGHPSLPSTTSRFSAPSPSATAHGPTPPASKGAANLHEVVLAAREELEDDAVAERRAEISDVREMVLDGAVLGDERATDGVERLARVGHVSPELPRRREVGGPVVEGGAARVPGETLAPTERAVDGALAAGASGIVRGEDAPGRIAASASAIAATRRDGVGTVDDDEDDEIRLGETRVDAHASDDGGRVRATPIRGSTRTASLGRPTSTSASAGMPPSGTSRRVLTCVFVAICGCWLRELTPPRPFLSFCG